MVVNVETVQVISKDVGSLRDSSAIVANGYFRKAAELNGIQVEVDKQSLESSEKFKKVKLTFKSGPVKMAYMNLIIHDSPVKSKKLIVDKFGKTKMSVTLPEDCVVGFEKLGQFIHSQLKSQGVKLGEVRTLVYSDKDNESHWVYVEYDNKDKYLEAVLNDQAFDVDAFNQLTLGVPKANITLGVQVYLWTTDSGSFDYSLKMKIVNIQTSIVE